MKFTFTDGAMRMTPETDHEYRILQKEFSPIWLNPSERIFQYVITYDGDFVKRVIEQLQRSPFSPCETSGS